MSVSIDILPFTNILELEGEPDPSSAYSLSGNVAITINDSNSIFDRHRTLCLLLQSLIITFEGQTELVTPETGYTGYRICSIAKELAPTEPAELSNEGHETSDKPCTWNVLFNLAIPGWLPPSNVFGDCENGPSGTRYALHATAKFTTPDQPGCQMPFATRFLSTFCMSIGSNNPKVVRAPRREISINRFMPPVASSSSPPHRTFCVQVHDDESSVIPAGVLSKIKVTASVPEQIDMDENSLQLRLRIRAQDLDPVHCERLRMARFSVDVQQLEKYRTKPSRAYTSRFPVPTEASQPPHVPLLIHHPLEQLQVLGMLPDTQKNVIDRTVSLNPEDASGLYQLSGDGYIFTPDVETTSDGSTCTWYAMEPSIPFSQRGTHIEGGTWSGDSDLRASGSSPFFVVRHQIHLSMICSYDVDGDRNNRVNAKMQFVLPVQFARIKVDEAKLRPLLTISPVHSRSSSSATSQVGTPTNFELPGFSPHASYYYAHPLPAYSQLFDSNGDRKIDYNLPVYTPYPPSSPVDDERP